MEIITWCNPDYFHFANGLIRSIRFHENEHQIILNLLDFTDDQYHDAIRLFDDSKITFIRTNIENNDYLVSDKVEFFRNFRPRFFRNMLDTSPSQKIVTFGANGLVFSRLDYIENLLDNHDFCFLERQKPNVFTNSPESVKSIPDLKKLIKDNNLSIDKVLESSTGKVVLLGTHGMRKNTHVMNVLEIWQNYIENSSNINKKFSDMNLFVKSIIEYEDKTGYSFNNDTNFDVHRSENYYCDTSFKEGNKIWFAKGPSKFQDSRYLTKLDFFLKFKYKL